MSPPQPCAESPRPTILIVDDDEDLRCTMRELTAVIGLGTCLAAESLGDVEAHGGEALGCTLAILDVNLGANAPSGIDVYRWLQRSHFTGTVVFLTGYGINDPLVQKTRSIAATRTLSKPISVEQLAALVGLAKAP